MSTSLLYHGWGLRGYTFQSASFIDGTIVFHTRSNRDALACSACGGDRFTLAGVVPRRFKTVPIGGKPVFLDVPVQRLFCHTCAKTLQTRLHFADPKRTYTHAFERYALELSTHMTIKAVAEHLNVGWDIIKDIQLRHLKRHFGRPPLWGLRTIAIDEISIGRGHRYLTVVLDLESGAVVFVGEGRGADALIPFWKRLKRSRAKIHAVATDMSPAYTLAVRENLPDAIHVFDHFHVIKLYNDQLAELRREVQRSVETAGEKKLLKGTLWLLMKNSENLNEEKNERAKLELALQINQPLACAYYMKEELRQLWRQPNKKAAETFLNSWCRRADESGVKMLKKFANTLRLHRTGLLNWYRCAISTGPLEGTNTKIRVMQRQGYGYRDQEFFRLKIYAIHLSSYALVG